MKLFIIGNDFDLDHKMKTKYKDFKEYIYNNYLLNRANNDLIDNSNDISIYAAADIIYKIINETVCDENWSNLENCLGEIDYLSLLELNMSLDDDDINHQIENNRLNINNLFCCFSYFDELLNNWIKKCNQSKIKPKRKYTNIFLTDSLYLTFNYTNLLKKIYNINSKNILHIHGDIYSKKIFGHTSSDPNVGLCGIGCEDLIKKIYRSLKKPVEKIIFENKSFFQKIKNIDEIYILGWSISDVDIKYLLEIKKALNGRRIKLHFTKYDKEQKEKGIKSSLAKFSKFKDFNYILSKYI